jgi:hypothetical protein
VSLTCSYRGSLAVVGGLAIAGGLFAWGGVARKGASAAIQPSYDKQTGKLTQLAYDSDHDGRPDTWTDMDGARPLRTRVDRNGDGKVDRWEEYDSAGALAKIGFSRRDTGIADAWVPVQRDGSIARIEISSTADERHIDRWEYYDVSRKGPDGKEALIRVEEDTKGDGKPHKWETYRDGALETVAFDQDGDGIPDLRLTYSASTLTLIESHPDGSGGFSVRTVVGK